METVIGIGLLQHPFTPSIGNVVERELIKLFNNVNKNAVENKTIGNNSAISQQDATLASEILTTITYYLSQIVPIIDLIQCDTKEVKVVPEEITEDELFLKFLAIALPQLKSQRFPNKLLYQYYLIWMEQQQLYSNWTIQNFTIQLRRVVQQFNFKMSTIQGRALKAIEKSDYDNIQLQYKSLKTNINNISPILDFKSNETTNTFKQKLTYIYQTNYYQYKK